MINDIALISGGLIFGLIIGMIIGFMFAGGSKEYFKYKTRLAELEGERGTEVYVITKGEYSDYHICAITTDKEIANDYANKFSDPWEKAEIETYDTYAISEMLRYKNMYKCYFFKETEEIKVEETMFNYWDKSDFKPSKCNYGYYVTVNADDSKMALKKASDIFAKYKAIDKELW